MDVIHYNKHYPSQEKLKKQNLEFLLKKVKEIFKFILKKNFGKDSACLNEARKHYYSARIQYNKKLIKDPSWVKIVIKQDWIN